jgi:hypothetical protein
MVPTQFFVKNISKELRLAAYVVHSIIQMVSAAVLLYNNITDTNTQQNTINKHQGICWRGWSLLEPSKNGAY